MFRVPLARCLAQRGSYALRKGSGVASANLRTTALTTRKPGKLRTLATVVPNEPAVLGPYKSDFDHDRQRIPSFKVMLGITSMKCTLPGERIPKVFMSHGIILLFELWADLRRQAYFANMSDPSKSPRTAFQPPPTLIPTPAGGVPSIVPGDSQGVDNDVTDHLKVQLLVRAYQVHNLPT